MNLRDSQQYINYGPKIIFIIFFYTLLSFFITTSAFAGALSFTIPEWQWAESDHTYSTPDPSYTILSDYSMSITSGGKTWGEYDNYASYFLANIKGDFTVTVKIRSQGNTDSWAKAGIMVKDEIPDNAKNKNGYGYTIIAATPGNGAVFQYDSDNDGFCDQFKNTTPYKPSPPYWLKLTKEGKTYTGYYSLDGTDWTEVKSVTYGTMKLTQDVGLFVTSGTNNSQSTVLFEDFTSDNASAATTYTVTSSSDDNGDILPDGATTVPEGESQTYTFAPSTGYHVDTVKIDYDYVTLVENLYTFDDVTEDHSIAITFSPLTYTITAYSAGNGTISPAGEISAIYGNSQTYSVTPDEGFEVDSVTVDGSTEELVDDKYTFATITENHEISVTFKTATSDPGGGDTETIAGCATNTSEDYSAGFDASKFDLNNMSVSDGVIVLSTGADSIDPDNIVIPFEQEISVSFLYEGAGHEYSALAWILKSDAVNADGSFKGWDYISDSVKHPIFRNIRDDSEGWGGNGILDSDSGSGSMPTTDEASLAGYDDGTEYKFIVDGDGEVTGKDMKKTLGTFAAGTEIVFFLTSNKDWDTDYKDAVFFSKTDWNPDTYGACEPADTAGDVPAVLFNKAYNLGEPNTTEGICVTDGDWLAEMAVDRLDTLFGITLSGTYDLPITRGQKFAHVIVGAPETDPDQWILGWEDLARGGDADHNDMTFKIHRKTGGVAELKSTEAIEPEDINSYYTAVTFEVWDSMPCSGNTEISYFVSIDNGDNWIEITDWDTINESDISKSIGTEIISWTPGTPEYTYRSRRIDFAGRDLYGRAIVWKAVMTSDDPSCTPQILDVAIEGNVSSNGSFSRGEPVVVANVLYSGSYETPSLTWTEKVQRGHLTSTRLYLPEDTTSTNESVLWDAGAVLSAASPSSRNIYFPNSSTASVTNEALATGDGTTTTFSGILAYYPVLATTLIITDKTESFEDKHTDVLQGNFGGTGTINRFTGVYSITFDSPPGIDVPVKANYTYYTTSNTLNAFNTTNINSSMLALDNSYLIGTGFTHDFNGDGMYNGVDESGTGTPDDSDGDWLVQWIRGYSDGSSTPKTWLLGPIDHSVPAVATPPGKPAWYYGSDISDSERASYDIFQTATSDRQTVAYVGSRDGMLHAFDAGKFRWGDNPDTAGIENRGYFLWESGIPNYGSGSELWAFIPTNLIPRLKNNKLSGEDRAFVDASPALADVYVDISDGSGKKWRTILLCAEGNGGDTVFSLDVTDPDNPFFLWEFADPDLFRSRSSPAVAQIGQILVDGTSKWVAFFVSGKSYDNTLYPSIYMIDVSDGSVLERIYLDAESAGIGGVPSGQPAIIDSDGNGFIDRLYVGTDKGFMYKVNLPDNPDDVDYPITHCIINTDFTDNDENTVAESQQYHPIYASPSVIVERDYSLSGEISSNIKIFFGTGDSPYYDEDINTVETTYPVKTYSSLNLPLKDFEY